MSPSESQIIQNGIADLKADLEKLDRLENFATYIKCGDCSILVRNSAHDAVVDLIRSDMEWRIMHLKSLIAEAYQ